MLRATPAWGWVVAGMCVLLLTVTVSLTTVRLAAVKSDRARPASIPTININGGRHWLLCIKTCQASVLAGKHNLTLALCRSTADLARKVNSRVTIKLVVGGSEWPVGTERPSELLLLPRTDDSYIGLTQKTCRLLACTSGISS